jgi:hypothetical protein
VFINVIGAGGLKDHDEQSIATTQTSKPTWKDSHHTYNEGCLLAQLTSVWI